MTVQQKPLGIFSLAIALLFGQKSFISKNPLSHENQLKSPLCCPACEGDRFDYRRGQLTFFSFRSDIHYEELGCSCCKTVVTDSFFSLSTSAATETA